MLQKFLLILASVSLNAFAQIFVRKGMLIMGNVSLNFFQIWTMIVGIFTNLYLLAGIASYGLSFLLWMIVLSKVNVSIAYPLGSIGYIITALIAYFFLEEPLTFQKICGILVICLGVFILTQSKDIL